MHGNKTIRAMLHRFISTRHGDRGARIVGIRIQESAEPGRARLASAPRDTLASTLAHLPQLDAAEMSAFAADVETARNEINSLPVEDLWVS